MHAQLLRESGCTWLPRASSGLAALVQLIGRHGTLHRTDRAPVQLAALRPDAWVIAGDVWEPQPPPKDHPWRSMPHNGMTPHYAGNTIDAQRR